jgi:hypothetical protein
MTDNLSEVSCRTLGILFQELPHKGLPVETLTQGIPYNLEHLQDQMAWIDWKSFRLFMSNAGKIWNDEELVEMGGKFLNSQFSEPTRTIARLFFTPKEFFQWISRQEAEGRSPNFNCTQGIIHDVGPNLLEFDLMMLYGYKTSSEFFMITKGTFIYMSAALGLKPSKVEMTPIRDGMRYVIQLPPGGGVLAGLRRLITWPFNIRSAARELKAANEQLQLRYRELEELVQERNKSERLQEALYRIAGIANSAASLKELYPAIHDAIRELMSAENFFIALYDQETDMLEIPYFVDEVDKTYIGPYPASNGLTERVIHSGQPLLIDNGEHQRLVGRGGG